jgi:hypothetical protein
MLDRAGVMHVTEAGPTLKILASNPIGETADCTPAFSEKKIYIRTRSDLFCISVD